MAEYIEREAAIKTAEHAYNEWNLAMAAADGKREINLVYKRQELCKAVASIFDSTPAADVAPVVQGRWERRRNSWYCTNCGKGYIITYGMLAASAYSYCPNCGALMDGDVGNG